jgi:hypothetical protein
MSNWHNPHLGTDDSHDMASSCFRNHSQTNHGHIPAFPSYLQPKRWVDRSQDIAEEESAVNDRVVLVVVCFWQPGIRQQRFG